MITDLPPDTIERGHGAARLLPACPFCGSSPILGTARNSATGIFVARVLCIDDDCMASIVCADRDRAEAQDGAIAAWSRRPRPTAPATEQEDG